MIRTFTAISIQDIEDQIDDFAREYRLTVDCFSIVYNGQYEALVKFGVRL